jgi:hypothetical protein
LPTNDHEPGRSADAPAEKSFWALLPRRNFRRVLFLIVALVAIIAIKRMGGFSLGKLFDGVAPNPQTEQRPFQRLEVKPR